MIRKHFGGILSGIILFICCWAPNSGNANTLSVIYDNGQDGTDISWIASEYQQIADDFQFLSPYLVTDAHWIGAYRVNEPLTDNFTIRLYLDDGNGMPTAVGTQIYEDNVGEVSRILLSDQIHYEYWTYIDPFLAESGKKYWFEIYNDIDQPDWGWGSNEFAGGNAVYTYEGEWLSLDGFEQAFQLTGTPVPEPTTMLLLGTGLVGVVGAARRKKKNQA